MNHRAATVHGGRSQDIGKLQLVVKVETAFPAACIIVRGQISTRSILVIYAAARRINAAVPGADIAVDLGHAGIAAEALEQLMDVADRGLLPDSVDPSRLPCHLRILESSGQLA
ncbi:hypothetical protein [Paenarthrobacter aurescens]|uniref:hypothetical protein n=1 Tax=Paenarthrobacter aurescens TaxID=43663 RepID=UPI0021C108B9|nr:hypothetical protein [Paenarthrobacter aurescens]